QHAHTEEGKIEVELAQLKYLLPRLTGKGKELSRLGGGIGTRGPGERQLEYDRRKIQVKIKRLEKKLAKLLRHRENIGRRRRKFGLPLGAIVGYTNAGKTSLINALTRSHLPAGNKLFMTLDTRMRKLYLPNRQMVILTDTVGFIRRLPTELLASFKATLEETVNATFLLHVVDASSTEKEEMIKTVKKILGELGVLDKPMVEIFNKIDLLNPWEKRRLQREYPESVLVSSLTGEGLEELKARIVETLKDSREELEIFLPQDKLFLLNEIYQQGEVLNELSRENGVQIRAKLDKSLAQKIKGLLGG
ncbi:MAG: GTPase HflX, partial [Caldiserica bacterium]|nr:GTPase HflX [Caldisericota bacterium]